MNARIEEKFPGIYYISGIFPFETQLVVTGQLNRELHSSLRVLSKNVQESDVKLFLKSLLEDMTPGDKNNADAVLQVSVGANQEIYQRIKEDSSMSEVLQRLMKDEIDKSWEDGQRAGERVGEEKGEIRTLIRLYNNHKITIYDIAEEIGGDYDQAIDFLQKNGVKIEKSVYRGKKL